MNYQSIAVVFFVACAGLSACKPQSEPEQAAEAKAEPAAVESDSAVTVQVSLEDDIASSRAAIKQLGSTLKSELQAAMQAGGPLQALDVCHTKAQELTAAVTAEQGPGMSVSRTSLKFRNANNAPNEWQRHVLENFEAQKMTGDDPATLEYHEVVETSAGKEFRYIKAIPTGDVCLKCHGKAIDSTLQEKLNEYYPDDNATGFEKGDLRGAFVVIKSL